MGELTKFKELGKFKPYQTIRIDLSKGLIKGTVTEITFKDKDTEQIVMYCPAFEITGYGDTRNEAMEMFKFALLDFHDYLIKLPVKKIELELKNLGWSNC